MPQDGRRDSELGQVKASKRGDMRSFGRESDQMRPVSIDVGFTTNADGSALVAFGNTRVICTACLEDRVPLFLRHQNRGWVTAEYGMLPGSTDQRTPREASRGKQSGRSVEIQRLIGRSLRSAVAMDRLGECTVTLDCDVIQADGGTRTASISGAWVALAAALWKHHRRFDSKPLHRGIAAVSLGLRQGDILVDLDYEEDAAVDVDLNLIWTHGGRLVEVQGTAEAAPFDTQQLDEMLRLGRSAMEDIRGVQIDALIDYGVESSWLP